MCSAAGGSALADSIGQGQSDGASAATGPSLLGRGVRSVKLHRSERSDPVHDGNDEPAGSSPVFVPPTPPPSLSGPPRDGRCKETRVLGHGGAARQADQSEPEAEDEEHPDDEEGEQEEEEEGQEEEEEEHPVAPIASAEELFDHAGTKRDREDAAGEGQMGRLKCRRCDQSFTQHHSRQDHEEHVHDGISYECPVCKSKSVFTLRSNFGRHLRDSHPKMPRDKESVDKCKVQGPRP
jgi:hypothetical protein